MKYALVTFGCRANQADSAGLDGDLRAVGGRPTTLQDANLVVVNTCSVTSAADQSARQAIRRIRRGNPEARIVVTGCYATRAADELSGLPGVEAVVPNGRKEQLAADLRPLIASLPDGKGDGPCGTALEVQPSSRTVQLLGVQTGCDDTCTYCIIPRTRGHGRSRPFDNVLARVRSAVADGVKEVVLTGVHLGSYGRDLAPGTSLLSLAQALDALAVDCRFRLSSLEPMDCEPGLVDLVARRGRFVPHFHLPLQHASDACLRAMGRPYTRDDYRRVVDSVRDALPDAAIGTDLIAGFPGETAADHAASLDYLAGSPITSVHVFPYADRPGTLASRLPQKIDVAVARRRARELREVAEQLQQRFRQRAVGTVRPALTLGGGGAALTDNYLKVELAPAVPGNCLVDVRIASTTGKRTIGELVGSGDGSAG
ncbi:MAG: MiaB/RimO family radical SAM methylthiotransferase [Vicinamibacterales bacterium]|jgi:threonylcarbamoyladenosine tRNA methylthiotransferase MtaB|nr:MiaB/RimO family radical SAM methylthiotransferase [Vicinamibacterales bacterium]MDP6609503.1 MiaB/RimO family radical SAM methylthiotransferase [Vicinamibacterales bacterium]|tara:strand:+ start:6159 stop:7442 length:1284 start_codon:yes stop_codon:yes gene_type:complete